MSIREISLAAFFLTVICGPFELARVSLVDEEALPTSRRAEVEYCSIVSDVHHSCGWGERLTAERAFVRPRQYMALPDLLGFAFSLPECENVSYSDGPLYVPCYDSAFVFSFEESDPNLDDFARDAGPTHDLRDLSRYRFLS